jgi:hypothetical protein
MLELSLFQSELIAEVRELAREWVWACVSRYQHTRGQNVPAPMPHPHRHEISRLRNAHWIHQGA